MGQKTHPYGFRLGYTKNWLSRWYSKKDYAAFVFEDDSIRKYVRLRCKDLNNGATAFHRYVLSVVRRDCINNLKTCSPSF